ncbi:MAG: hypothetical protein QOJ86_3095 [Bradyrhizobium sp.]|jgi:hypothetical protein|nr:hypothetical protein [Bradyrhizobium sp.]
MCYSNLTFVRDKEELATCGVFYRRAELAKSFLLAGLLLAASDGIAYQPITALGFSPRTGATVTFVGTAYDASSTAPLIEPQKLV